MQGRVDLAGEATLASRWLSRFRCSSYLHQVELKGVEPSLVDRKSTVLPLNYNPKSRFSFAGNRNPVWCVRVDATSAKVKGQGLAGLTPKHPSLPHRYFPLYSRAGIVTIPLVIVTNGIRFRMEDHNLMR